MTVPRMPQTVTEQHHQLLTGGDARQSTFCGQNCIDKKYNFSDNDCSF